MVGGALGSKYAPNFPDHRQLPQTNLCAAEWVSRIETSFIFGVGE